MNFKISIKICFFNINTNYISNKSTKIKHDYVIYGLLEGVYSDNIIWNKEYEIKKGSINDSTFTINEDIVIDYTSLKEEVDSFKDKLGLYLDVNYYLILKVDNKEQIKVSFSLSNSTFIINKDNINNSEEILESKNVLLNKINYIYLLGSILLLVLSIYLFIKKYKIILNKDYNSLYEKKLHKIKLAYNEIIVEVLDKINEKGYQVINVYDISELIDIEEQLKVPINLYTLNNISEFTIIYNKLIYKFILK